MRVVQSLLIGSFWSSFLLAASPSRAQSASPAGSDAQKPATTGSMDVAKSGFASDAKPADDKTTVNDVAINAGGLFAAGNARSTAVTFGSKGRVRRDNQQFSYGAAANYARGAKPGEPVDTTVENLQGILRYDYYFVDAWSLFLQTSARRDRFQGLALRYNLDPGVAHYFIEEKGHRLWLEAGYDFQYDIRTQRAIDDAANPVDPVKTPPIILNDTKIAHSIRTYVGYENKLNEAVSFTASVEYLQSVQHAEAARLNFDGAIKTQVANHLSIATTLSVRYDNAPLPTVMNTDAIAAVSLVYSVF